MIGLSIILSLQRQTHLFFYIFVDKSFIAVELAIGESQAAFRRVNILIASYFHLSSPCMRTIVITII